MTLSCSNPVFFSFLKNYCIYYDDGDSPVHRGARICVSLTSLKIYTDIIKSKKKRKKMKKTLKSRYY